MVSLAEAWIPDTAATPIGWPTLDEAAYYGLAGEVVRRMEPHTEADPVGLLTAFLCGFGSLVGAGPHAVADSSKHPGRLFVVLVGKTSRARKGTTWANIRRPLQEADPVWADRRMTGGLSSGEGLISALKDEDDPTSDRRLMVVEPEFARVLQVCNRESSTLSAIIRDAWDRGDLRILTKNPTKVDGAHVSILGNITIEELRQGLDRTEVASGFANRFLFVAVRRSKKLPQGGSLAKADIEELGQLVSDASAKASKISRVRRTALAEKLWAEIYGAIDDDVDGLLGAVTAREEAQMLRLQVVYALLDGSDRIDECHVEAARAVWDYCEQSAALIFGGRFGNPTAERLYDAIVAVGEHGLDGSQQHQVFGRNVSARRIEAARIFLERRGLIQTVREQTGGRPRVRSFATKNTTKGP